MDGAAYQDGRRVPGQLTLDEAWRWHERDDLPEEAFVWLGLHMPSPNEIATAQKMFDLHELAVEDALGDHVRPSSRSTTTPSSWCCAPPATSDPAAS